MHKIFDNMKNFGPEHKNITIGFEIVKLCKGLKFWKVDSIEGHRVEGNFVLCFILQVFTNNSTEWMISSCTIFMDIVD